MKPEDVPAELLELTAAALCNNDDHGVTWDRVRHARADRYRRLASRALAAVLPVHERQVRAKVAAEIEAAANDLEPRHVQTIATFHRAARIARGAS